METCGKWKYPTQKRESIVDATVASGDRRRNANVCVRNATTRTKGIRWRGTRPAVYRSPPQLLLYIVTLARLRLCVDGNEWNTFVRYRGSHFCALFRMKMTAISGRFYANRNRSLPEIRKPDGTREVRSINSLISCLAVRSQHKFEPVGGSWSLLLILTKFFVLF